MALVDGLKSLNVDEVEAAVQSTFDRLNNDDAMEAATDVLLRDYDALFIVALGIHQAALDRGQSAKAAGRISEGSILTLLVVKELAEREIMRGAEPSS